MRSWAAGGSLSHGGQTSPTQVFFCRPDWWRFGGEQSQCPALEELSGEQVSCWFVWDFLRSFPPAVGVGCTALREMIQQLSAEETPLVPTPAHSLSLPASRKVPVALGQPVHPSSLRPPRKMEKLLRTVRKLKLFIITVGITGCRGSPSNTHQETDAGPGAASARLVPPFMRDRAPTFISDKLENDLQQSKS